jgi:hypothetical protein
MNMTRSAFLSLKSERENILPLTTSGSRKSGAEVFKRNMVDEVRAIVISLRCRNDGKTHPLTLLFFSLGVK